MGLDQYAHLRGKKLDIWRWYDDTKDESCSEQDQFIWRKHARLQVFMDKQHKKQNKERKLDSDLQHLGFNSDADTPYVLVHSILLDELEEQIKTDYHDCFCSDGFFWGQQYQEESAKEYKDQDLEFVKWARQQIQNGKEVVYECSW